MKKTVIRLLKVVIPTVISLFFFTISASAHVTVSPNTSTTGAWETYTLKVPVEKDVATTKVTVKTPEGVEIMSYQPVPGWTYSTEKDANGKVKTFTFEATGEGIVSGQFQQFVFVAKNPEKVTKVAWNAFQYYKDGSIVEWTGDEGSDSPHSITDVVTSTSSDHNETTAPEHTEQTEKPQTTEMEGKDSSNTLPLLLSGVSVLLSLVALVLAIRKK